MAHTIKFAVCIENEGAEDLELHKIYRVLPDKSAAASRYLRVIDESGEDYLYPASRFVFVDLPRKVTRALGGPQRSSRRARAVQRRT